MRPDLHTAMFVPIQVNEINLDDISILINDLRDLFKVDCDIEEIADGIYLMELREFDAPLHYPHPLSVMGKAAIPYIEQSWRGSGVAEYDPATALTVSHAFATIA